MRGRATIGEIKSLYATLTFADQEALRNEFFSWQPRCSRCGTPKYLGSVGCPGAGHEHRPALTGGSTPQPDSAIAASAPSPSSTNTEE